MHVNNLTVVAPDIGAKHYGIGSGVSKLVPFGINCIMNAELIKCK